MLFSNLIIYNIRKLSDAVYARRTDFLNYENKVFFSTLKNIFVEMSN